MKLLPLAFLLAACASPDPYADCARQCATRDGPTVAVCVDSAFSATEQSSITNAVKTWATVVCDRRFGVRTVDGAEPPSDCTLTLLRVESWYPWVQERPPGAVAFAEPERGVCWLVVDVIPAELLRPAAAHEIGHLLGADHGGGVMSAGLTDACIWQASVDSLKGPQ